jgi:hypothetical protein
MRILTSINSTRLVLVWMGLFSAAIGLPEKAAATTIVVIRTPSEVVIAADSLATIRADAGSSSTESVCKIYQLNSKLFFAVSGLVNDGLTGFSIPDVVGRPAGSAMAYRRKWTRRSGGCARPYCESFLE